MDRAEVVLLNRRRRSVDELGRDGVWPRLCEPCVTQLRYGVVVDVELVKGLV